MASLPLSEKEQEALFQVIIRRIPSIKEPGQLQELATQALELMLRRPEDHELKLKLRQNVLDIFIGIEVLPDSPVLQERMRRAARSCIDVLQAAKEHRLPRDTIFPSGVRHSPSHKSPPKRPANRVLRGVIGIVVLISAIGGGAIAWRLWTDNHATTFEASQFTRQIVAIANGAPNAQTVFGGTIERQKNEKNTVVIATHVPPKLCASSSWDLVHQGILTINGITPNRVSWTVITELCDSDAGSATLIWKPKATP